MHDVYTEKSSPKDSLISTLFHFYSVSIIINFGFNNLAV